MNDPTPQKKMPGCYPEGVDPEIACEVYRIVRLGSPTLALSVASGVPLTPSTVTITGSYTSVTQVVVKEAVAKHKIYQDTLIDEIDYLVQHTVDVPGGIDPLTN